MTKIFTIHSAKNLKLKNVNLKDAIEDELNIVFSVKSITLK